MNTRSPHLDLEDLIAEVTGQTTGDRAREHLASCEQCRAEANRWDAVAGGVRALAAAATTTVFPSAEPEAPAVAHPRPPHARPRFLADPRRRFALAAAALVLIGGASYWASASGSAPSAPAVLTAVSGCAPLVQANGTLQQVNGDSLVIMTSSGRPVTVTTTSSTFVGMSGALLSDIGDGASVIVLGPSSAGTITAAGVTVGPFIGNGTPTVTPPPGWAAVHGTVSDVSAAGFTVVAPSGTRVPVTTSSNTHVVIPHASLSQLRAGATIVAFGHAGPNGTLSAVALSQTVPLPPSSGAQVHATLHVHAGNCSPDALALALASGV